MPLEEVGGLELPAAVDAVVDGVHVDGVDVAHQIPPTARLQTTSFTPVHAVAVPGVKF